MEKIRYPWDWRVLLLGAGGFFIAFMIVIFSNPSYPQFWEFVLVSSVILLFLILNFTLGTYGLLDKKNLILSRTDYFFYTKCVSVKDIKSIYYRPTWIVGGLARSLYIVNDSEKVIEFPNVGWYEPVLAQIVRDLKQLNPSIQLDDHAEVLIKKYENKS